VFAGAANPTRWYHGDLLGSLILTTDDVGQLQSTSLYDSFGSRFPTSLPDVAQRFAFTGRQYIPETGLYDYRSRHYLAEMGRFLTTDTIGFDGGDTNLYRYVFNSPVVFTDPFGTTVFSEYQIKVKLSAARKEIIKCLGKKALDKFSEAGLYLLVTSVVDGSNAYAGRSVNINKRIQNHISNQVGNRGAEVRNNSLPKSLRKKLTIGLSKHIVNNPEKFRTAEQILVKHFGGKDALLNTINASNELFCKK
jgi:RHS repeat-associated protein